MSATDLLEVAYAVLPQAFLTDVLVFTSAVWLLGRRGR